MNRSTKALCQGERRREHLLDPHRRRRSLQAFERMIAIVDQVSWSLVPWKGLAQLLGGPRRRRMHRDRDVVDPAPVVGDEHEDEQEAVSHRRDHEEIGCHDLADMIP